MWCTVWQSETCGYSGKLSLSPPHRPLYDVGRLGRKQKRRRGVYFFDYCSSWLPITRRTLANSNQNRFPLDFCHTFTLILPSLTRTLDNSNLPLTRSNFCFPSDHFYIILPSITRTMFCSALFLIKIREKTVYWRPKHWILNFPLKCCRYLITIGGWCCLSQI